MYLPATISFLSFSFAIPYPRLLRATRQRQAYARQVQQLGERAPHLPALELVAAILACLDIRVEFEPADLNKLPAAGAFLAIANQPGDLLHTLVALHVLGAARPDVSALLDAELAPPLPQLAPRFLARAPCRAGEPDALGLPRLLGKLPQGGPLVMFSDSSDLLATYFSAEDEQPVATPRLPVVPLWFSSRPSSTYTWWDVMHLLLQRPLSLPGELLCQRGTTVRVRIGSAIAAPVIQRLPPAARLAHVQGRVAELAGV